MRVAGAKDVTGDALVYPVEQPHRTEDRLPYGTAAGRPQVRSCLFEEPADVGPEHQMHIFRAKQSSARLIAIRLFAFGCNRGDGRIPRRTSPGQYLRISQRGPWKQVYAGEHAQILIWLMLRELVSCHVKIAIGCDIFIGDVYATIGILSVVQLGVMSEEIPRYSANSGVQTHAPWRFIESKSVGPVVPPKLVPPCFVREVCSENIVVQLTPRDKPMQFTRVNLGQLVVCDDVR